MARMHGAKNVNDFVRQTGGGPNFNQMGTEQVLGEAAKGNVIPITQAMQMGGGMPG
jgi:hypothetical protein